MFKLLEFQLKALNQLIELIDENEKTEIIFKSPTGSGKTIVLTHLMKEYGKGHFQNVFVWLTPGKGNLEEQSKKKMDKYVPNSSTKLLHEVMTEGFQENDACFINWEKLTKKGNNALKEGEKTNFKEHIEIAHKNDLEFIIIVDESHQNNTVKANDIIELFKPKKIIRASATPKNYSSANVNIVEVNEEDVIAEGLIKKMLIINEGFGNEIEVNDQVEYLLEKALDKQKELKKAFEKEKLKVNPLIIIQLPKKSEILQDQVERYLATKDITYENGLLAIWLDKQKQNLEEIEKLDAKPIVIIIKQAIATGWDCPRAHILVKLRDNTSETFEIQTIGRIRRMPEVKHYENDLLDSCYLYTFDEKFTEGVKTHLGNNALEALKLFLKEKYRNVSLITEQKKEVPISSDATIALKTMVSYFEKHYGITTKTNENKLRLETKGYKFSNKIVKKTFKGSIHLINKNEFEQLETVKMFENLDTHKHGREYHHRVSSLGVKLLLPYEKMNTIIRRLFDKNVKYDKKILKLETKEVYSFVINNYEQLKDDILSSMSDVEIQAFLDLPDVTEREFHFPRELLFTYNSKNKIQKEYESNVYKGYLSSAEIRSDSEKTFEKFCEESSSVEWFYKNGDKGNEFFSLVYQDNFGKQKSFYPDYVLSVNGDLWIIETKGGFSRNAQSEDIDKFSSKKFEVLKEYLKKHNLKGGFVRKDKSNNELFICMDKYNDDISSSEWKLLSEVLK